MAENKHEESVLGIRLPVRINNVVFVFNTTAVKLLITDSKSDIKFLYIVVNPFYAMEISPRHRGTAVFCLCGGGVTAVVLQVLECSHSPLMNQKLDCS